MPDNTTIDILIDEPVNSRWEPCHAFSATGPESPVCSGCGWLDGEHRLAS